MGRSGHLSAVTALVALVLAGCSDSSSPKGVDSARVEPDPALMTDVSLTNLVTETGLTWYPAATWRDTVDPVASPSARKGGVMRFNGSQFPSSYNAYIDNGQYTIMMFSMMYGSLIGTDPETLEIVPQLARRWAVSDDGSVFIFEIDPRAVWSDGVPVSADDVLWTYDAVMGDSAMTGHWKMMLGAFERPIVLDAQLDGEVDGKPAKVANPRPRLIRFQKKRNPDGSVIYDWRDITTCGNFFVLPKHYFDGKEFNALDFVGAPVCGPYRLTRVADQEEAEYTRDPNWWRADAPSNRGLYNFDRIVMRYYMTQENAFDAFKQRKIDLYPVYSARIWKRETTGTKFERNWIVKRRVTNREPVGYQGFAMNMRRPPFDDIHVRRAMAHLINRKEMVESMMYGEYFLQSSFYSDLYAEGEAPEPTPYDVEKAKEELAAAGYVYDEEKKALCKDGRPLTFKFLSRDGNDRYLTQFYDDLAKLGITMTIDQKDFASWMKDMSEFNFDMTWDSRSSGTIRMPEVSWHSREANRHNGGNHVGFKDPAVDELIAREKTMKTRAEREDAYRRIDALINAKCPYAFLWNIAAKRLLYWNKFGTPTAVLSCFGDERDALAYWWYDEDRVDELEEAVEHDRFLPALPAEVDYDRTMKGVR